MAYTLDGSDYKNTWHVECAVAATVQNPLMAKALGLASILHAEIPLVSVELKLLAAPAVNTYSYIIVAVDGRTWSQVIQMDQPTNPNIQRKDAVFWRLAEIQKTDPLRQAIMDLIQSIQPSIMTVTFA